MLPPLPVEAKATRLGEPTAPLPILTDAQTAQMPIENVKATRLGASAATAAEPAVNVTANNLKATRLGNVQNFNAQQTEVANAAAGSFLSNLKPAHYIGAGIGAVVLLGLFILVPAIILLSGGKTAAEDVKPDPAPKVEEAQKPSIIEMPKPPPVENTPITQPSLPDTTTLGDKGDSGIKPVEDKPADKPVADKPADKPADKSVAGRSADKSKTVAGKSSNSSSSNKNASSGESKQKGRSRAEDLLTGNKR